MEFQDGKEMYEYLKHHDLYDKESEVYVFLYNEDGALCTYDVTMEEACSLAEKSAEDDGQYWGAYLGPGGTVLDNTEYEPEQELYLQPSYDFCDRTFDKGWTDIADFAKETVMMEEADLER
jgi:phytoene dehydrogenase-like protein